MVINLKNPSQFLSLEHLQNKSFFFVLFPISMNVKDGKELSQVKIYDENVYTMQQQKLCSKNDYI